MIKIVTLCLVAPLKDVLGITFPKDLFWSSTISLGWRWLLDVYDWDTIIVSNNFTALVSYELQLCTENFPCVLQVKGFGAKVEVSGSGQITCLSSLGCSQISVTTTSFVCSNNTKSVFKMQSSFLTLQNVSFTDCWSDNDGGVVQAYDMATVMIEAGIFLDIHSSGFGGVLSAYGSNLTIMASYFHNCSALGGGGAVWSSAFQDSYGSNQVRNNYLRITSSNFSLCTAGGAGGAVLADSGGLSVIDEVLDVSIMFTGFYNCTAAGDGGALRISGALVMAQMGYSRIDSCTSQSSGGATSSSDASSLSLITCEITGNTALGMGGGAVHINRSYFSAFNLSSSSNHATRGGGGGLYWQGWISPAALECPEGTSFSLVSCTSAIIDSSSCKIGSCAPCSAGSFQNYAVGPICHQCKSGSFSIFSGSSRCNLCSVGKFSTVVGANSSAVCWWCGPGTYSDTQGSSSCISCPAGTFSSVDAASSLNLCLSCAAGKYSSVEGANSSAVCVTCGLGTYSDEQGSSSCTTCPAGTFAVVKAASSSNVCVSCAAGEYSSVDGANSSAVCLSCEQGTYSAAVSSSSCTSCPAGTFSSADHASSSNVCLSCVAGKYSAVQGASTSEECIRCSSGTYSDILGSSSCTSCPAGTFSTVDAANSTSMCILCPVGRYASLKGCNNSAVCVSCNPGTYSDAAGSSLCRGCPAGTFSPVKAASSSIVCESCKAGGYSSIESANSSLVCSLCGPGTYSNSTGRTSCSSCPTGQTSIASGATSLEECVLCWPREALTVAETKLLRFGRLSNHEPRSFREVEGSDVSNHLSKQNLRNKALSKTSVNGFRQLGRLDTAPMVHTGSILADLKLVDRHVLQPQNHSSSEKLIKGLISAAESSGVVNMSRTVRRILKKALPNQDLEQSGSSYDSIWSTRHNLKMRFADPVLQDRDLTSDKGKTKERMYIAAVSGMISINDKLPEAQAVGALWKQLRRTVLSPLSSRQDESLLLSSLCGPDTSALYGPCKATDYWALNVSDLVQSVYSGVPFEFTVTKMDAYGSKIVSDSSSVLQAIPVSSSEKATSRASILGSAGSILNNGVATFSFAIKADFIIDYANRSAYLHAPISFLLQGVDAQSGVIMNSGMISIDVNQGVSMCPPGYVFAPDQENTVDGPAVCTLCKPGTYSISPMTSIQDSSSSTYAPACLNCPAGCSCVGGGSQVKCKVGQWTTTRGIYILTSCPAGYQLINSTAGTSQGVFSTDIQQCIACQPGKYIINPNTDVCQNCPPGISQRRSCTLSTF